MIDDCGEAAAVLAEKIKDELGEGWTELPASTAPRGTSCFTTAASAQAGNGR